MRDVLIETARDTVALTSAGRYQAPSGATVDIAAEVDAAVARTFLLSENALGAIVATTPTATPTTPPRCLPLRSGAAAKLLLDEGAARVAVLNYANAFQPGGGFLSGSRAQEEALCRCSALYACLNSERAEARAFYDDHAADDSCIARDHLLVSPAVPFFRDEDLRLLERPFPVTVITGAAPDLVRFSARAQTGLEDRARLDELPAIFARRTAAVLAAARVAGCDALVIGPWGCGAFGNDPDLVADAFAAAVGRFGGHFERILVATFGPEQNRLAFERRFGPRDAT